MDVLRGPGMSPVAFVRGIAEPEIFRFLCPVTSAMNENTLLIVLSRFQSQLIVSKRMETEIGGTRTQLVCIPTTKRTKTPVILDRAQSGIVGIVRIICRTPEMLRYGSAK